MHWRCFVAIHKVMIKSHNISVWDSPYGDIKGWSCRRSKIWLWKLPSQNHPERNGSNFQWVAATSGCRRRRLDDARKFTRFEIASFTTPTGGAAWFSIFESIAFRYTLTHPPADCVEDKAKDKNIRGGEFGAEVLNLFMTNVFLSCQRQFDS